jgi:UDP-galactopyranose mutase
MLEGADVRTGIDFFDDRELWEAKAEKVVFTGKIDEYFGYRYGMLEYRTVSFEQETLDMANYQGNAVVNYTDREVPYTRVIEHKHFEMFGQEVYDNPKTVVSREFSTEWKPGMEPYYPVNDERNNSLAEQYRALAAQEKNVIFGGRPAEYKYYDMAPIVEKVLGMELK